MAQTWREGNHCRPTSDRTGLSSLRRLPKKDNSALSNSDLYKGHGQVSMRTVLGKVPTLGEWITADQYCIVNYPRQFFRHHDASLHKEDVGSVKFLLSQ